MKAGRKVDTMVVSKAHCWAVLMVASTADVSVGWKVEKMVVSTVDK